MFQFVSDRKPQGISFGPGGARCLADQSRFVSIWGHVSGPTAMQFTADQIAAGEIYSQDGKANLGGTPVLVNGKPHIVHHQGNSIQEFQIPIEDARQWSAYEGKQSTEACNRYLQSPLTTEDRNENVQTGHAEFNIEYERVEMEPPKYDTQVGSTPVKKAQSGWTPERRAAQSAKMKARHAQQPVAA